MNVFIPPIIYDRYQLKRAQWSPCWLKLPTVSKNPKLSTQRKVQVLRKPYNNGIYISNKYSNIYIVYIHVYTIIANVYTIIYYMLCLM